MFETFIAVGIIISLIYYELTHLSPGGVITPGYLALFLDQPARLASTLLVALLTYGIILLLKRYLPIYGRRQFAAAVAIAILLKLLFGEVVIGGASFSIAISSIGVIVPGLIANDMVKQSVGKTIASMGLVTIFLFCVLSVMNGSV